MDAESRCTGCDRRSAIVLGRTLDAAERALVMAGWRDERAEVWQ